MNFNEIVNVGKVFWEKNGSTILVGVGSVSMLAATGLAFRSGMRCQKKLEERKKELKTDMLEPMEVVKTVWKDMLPFVGLAGGGAGLVFKGTKDKCVELAGVATALALEHDSFKEYKEQVKEVFGARKEKEKVVDPIAEKHLKTDPASSKQIILTRSGDTLFRDEYTKQYFRSDIETVNSHVNRYNQMLVHEGSSSFNEWLNELEIEEVGFGEEVGFTADDLLDICFTASLTDNMEPCIVINYNTMPTRNYKERYMF